MRAAALVMKGTLKIVLEGDCWCHIMWKLSVIPVRSQMLRFNTYSWRLSTSLEKAKNLILWLKPDCMSMSWCGCHVHLRPSSIVHSASRQLAFCRVLHRDHENGVDRDPQWTHIGSFPRTWKRADWQSLADTSKLLSELLFSYPFVSILPV